MIAVASLESLQYYRIVIFEYGIPMRELCDGAMPRESAERMAALFNQYSDDSMRAVLEPYRPPTTVRRVGATAARRFSGALLPDVSSIVEGRLRASRGILGARDLLAARLASR